jgi:hypothetical protein
MHVALRGDALEQQLAQELSEHERAVVEELGRAARLVRGRLRADDFRTADGAASALVPGSPPVRASALRLDVLDLGDVVVDEPLAFASGPSSRGAGW